MTRLIVTVRLEDDNQTLASDWYQVPVADDADVAEEAAKLAREIVRSRLFKAKRKAAKEQK